jgi:uncharacterized protein
LAASDTYTAIMQLVLADANLLPAVGAMAGVITTNDNQRGVWTAPANVPIIGVIDLPIKLTDTQQGELNVDITGKSINAMRFFPTQGVLVWGARTLDGNSEDWRYLQVRRTLIYIEQSCKQALQQFIFEPNTSNTWLQVQSAISNFLAGVWSAGGLLGDKPEAAFSVTCGLGSTMTAEDLLNGVMSVEIILSVTRPGEFIEIALQQKMEGV